MISVFIEHQDDPHCNFKGVGSRITSLQYTFPCNMASRNETRLYGTGGNFFVLWIHVLRQLWLLSESVTFYLLLIPEPMTQENYSMR